jgi:hypothetical protein
VHPAHPVHPARSARPLHPSRPAHPLQPAPPLHPTQARANTRGVSKVPPGRDPDDSPNSGRKSANT